MGLQDRLGGMKMKCYPYPQVKLTDINLEPVTENALITTIDIFGFMHRGSNNYIDVFIGDDEPDYVDDIEVESNILTASDLEKIALKWIAEHVKLVSEID